MVLAWHTHYATSETKVYDKEALAGSAPEAAQTLAQPRSSQLHLAMLRDAAMLRWLDGTSNLRGAPNENLGREFLELFALGVGNYDENDVREAARALTGWQYVSERRPPLKYMEVLHDPGEKTILGKTGAWSDEDLARIASAIRPPRGGSPGGCGARSFPTSTNPRPSCSKDWQHRCALTATWT